MKRAVIATAAGIFVVLFHSTAIAQKVDAERAKSGAKQHGCLNCHDIDKKKMGPGFKDVAAAHKGKAGDEAALVAKITGGKDHPPIKASEADVKTLVKWVLAM